jgi:hypothetical protein
VTVTHEEERVVALGPIEQAVSDAVGAYLDSDACKKALEERVGVLVKDALDDAFGIGGDVRSALRKRFEDIAIPAIERWGGASSDGNIKLDAIITRALEGSIEGERSRIYDNLDRFLAPKRRLTINASELLEAYAKWVAHDISCEGREVDEESERYVDVCVGIALDDAADSAQRNLWSTTSVRRAALVFDIREEEDDVASEFFRSVPISQWSHARPHGTWDLDYKMPDCLTSVLRASSFDILLARLASDDTKVEWDMGQDYGELDVTPRETPQWQLQ